MKLLLIALLAVAAAACHPGPIVGKTPAPDAQGTIAGIVSTSGKVPLAGRKVTAVNTATGERFEATTAANGGYTLQVPHGQYRLELELREGERLAQQPGETRVNRSDLDPRRDFVIAVAGTHRARPAAPVHA